MVTKKTPLKISLNTGNISEFLYDMQEQLKLSASATDEGDCFVLKLTPKDRDHVDFSITKGVEVDLSDIVAFIREITK